jgi:hypothetical protein
MWGIGRGADALGLSKLAGPVEYHGYLGAVQAGADRRAHPRGVFFLLDGLMFQRRPACSVWRRPAAAKTRSDWLPRSVAVLVASFSSVSAFVRSRVRRSVWTVTRSGGTAGP